MGTEQFANGQVTYQDPNGVKKSCIDSLRDDVRYRFDCRCGCKAGFSGFGKDIKASGKVGQSTFPAIKDIHTRTSSAPTTLTIDGLYPDTVWVSTAKDRPFVSDRYLKKVVFGISDDEIDEDSESHQDAAEGMNLADRQPPGIGELVYSLATNDGPYSLLDYGTMEVSLSESESHIIHCGIVRTANGEHLKIPIADLANHWEDRPVKKPSNKWVRVLLAMVASSIIGSAITIAIALG